MAEQSGRYDDDPLTAALDEWPGIVRQVLDDAELMYEQHAFHYMTSDRLRPDELEYAPELMAECVAWHLKGDGRGLRDMARHYTETTPAPWRGHMFLEWLETKLADQEIRGWYLELKGAVRIKREGVGK